MDPRNLAKQTSSAGRAIFCSLVASLLACAALSRLPTGTCAAQEPVEPKASGHELERKLHQALCKQAWCDPKLYGARIDRVSFDAQSGTLRVVALLLDEGLREPLLAEVEEQAKRLEIPYRKLLPEFTVSCVRPAIEALNRKYSQGSGDIPPFVVPLDQPGRFRPPEKDGKSSALQLALRVLVTRLDLREDAESHAQKTIAPVLRDANWDIDTARLQVVRLGDIQAAISQIRKLDGVRVERESCHFDSDGNVVIAVVAPTDMSSEEILEALRGKLPQGARLEVAKRVPLKEVLSRLNGRVWEWRVRDQRVKGAVFITRFHYGPKIESMYDVYAVLSEGKASKEDLEDAIRGDNKFFHQAPGLEWTPEREVRVIQVFTDTELNRRLQAGLVGNAKFFRARVWLNLRHDAERASLDLELAAREAQAEAERRLDQVLNEVPIASALRSLKTVRALPMAQILNRLEQEQLEWETGSGFILIRGFGFDATGTPVIQATAVGMGDRRLEGDDLRKAVITKLSKDGRWELAVAHKKQLVFELVPPGLVDLGDIQAAISENGKLDGVRVERERCHFDSDGNVVIAVVAPTDMSSEEILEALRGKLPQGARLEVAKRVPLKEVLSKLNGRVWEWRVGDQHVKGAVFVTRFHYGPKIEPIYDVYAVLSHGKARKDDLERSIRDDKEFFHEAAGLEWTPEREVRVIQVFTDTELNRRLQAGLVGNAEVFPARVRLDLEHGRASLDVELATREAQAEAEDRLDRALNELPYGAALRSSKRIVPLPMAEIVRRLDQEQLRWDTGSGFVSVRGFGFDAAGAPVIEASAFAISGTNPVEKDVRAGIVRRLQQDARWQSAVAKGESPILRFVPPGLVSLPEIAQAVQGAVSQRPELDGVYFDPTLARLVPGSAPPELTWTITVGDDNQLNAAQRLLDEELRRKTSEDPGFSIQCDVGRVVPIRAALQKLETIIQAIPIDECRVTRICFSADAHIVFKGYGSGEAEASLKDEANKLASELVPYGLDRIEPKLEFVRIPSLLSHIRGYIATHSQLDGCVALHLVFRADASPVLTVGIGHDRQRDELADLVRRLTGESRFSAHYHRTEIEIAFQEPLEPILRALQKDAIFYDSLDGVEIRRLFYDGTDLAVGGLVNDDMRRRYVVSYVERTLKELFPTSHHARVATGVRATHMMKLRPPRSSVGESAFQRGEVLLRNRDLEGAIEQFRRAVRANPGHLRAWLRLSVSYLQTGDERRARLALRRAMTLVAGDLNIIHEQLEDFQGPARTRFNRMLLELADEL